jgi:hypothetical protein
MAVTVLSSLPNHERQHEGVNEEDSFKRLEVPFYVV